MTSYKKSKFMIRNRNHLTRTSPAAASPGQRALRISCRKAVAQIAQTRAAILAESARVQSADARLIRLAVNEAESLAWQTSYPHLVFPTLATEKIEALATWNRRQEAMRERSPVWALAV